MRSGWLVTRGWLGLVVGSCNATTPRKSVGWDSPWGETGFIPRQRGANMLMLFAGQYLEYLQIILLFWGNLKCEFIESIICQFDARFDFHRSLVCRAVFPNSGYIPKHTVYDRHWKVRAPTYSRSYALINVKPKGWRVEQTTGIWLWPISPG